MNSKLFILGLLLVLGSGLVWLAVFQRGEERNVTESVQTEASAYAPKAEPIFPGETYTPDPQLLSELSAIKPQFVSYSKHLDLDESLSPELLSIKNKLIPLVLGDRNYMSSNPDANIYLHAVGPRYVIAFYLAEKDSPPLPQLIDVENGTTVVLPERIEFTTGNTAVMFRHQSIYTYTLGDALPVLVPGSMLMDPETYDHCGDCLISPQVGETHTSDTATVSIWDFTTTTPRENGPPEPTFVRTFEFKIPQ